MMNCTLILTLLSTFSWIFVSDCQFHIVVVQSGEEVTLRCSNFTTFLSHIFWFKLADGPNIRCISSMFNAEAIPSFYDPFQSGKFIMTSNTTNIFLNIKQLDVKDSGLYLCGFYAEAFPAVFTATHLQVEVSHSDETDGSHNLLNWILGGIVIFLALIIIGFVVKIRTFYTDKKTTQRHENLDSCTLNYAPLSFPPKGKSNRRPAAQGEMETNVVYAATR